MSAEREAISATLRSATVVWSNETTTRIDGRLHWHWVFVTADAELMIQVAAQPQAMARIRAPKMSAS